MPNPFTNGEIRLSTVAPKPKVLISPSQRAQLRANRLVFVLFAVIVLIATASEARSSVFNQNEKLVGGSSVSSNVPWDWDITATPLPNNPLLVGDPVYIVYGIGVGAGNPNLVSVVISLPTGFTLTSAPVCFKYNGPSNPPVAGGTLLPANCTASNVTPGVMGNANDKVIAIYKGYFAQAGAFSASFSATGGALGTSIEQQFLSMNPQLSNLNVDLGITKQEKPLSSGSFGSTATVAIYPTPGTLSYKLRVTNLSAPDPNHMTDVYLGGLLKIYDTLSAPGNPQDVTLNVTVKNFLCTKSSAPVDCPTMPGTMSNILPQSLSWNLLLPPITYASTSNGFLPAGEWFEITFDAEISTSSQCSPNQNNKLNNVANFTYSNGTATVSDANPANNTSAVITASLPVNGLPTTCPTLLPVTVTKTVLIPGSWTTPFTYKITITNPNSVTLSLLTLTDYVGSSATTPPFTATPSNVNCLPVCSSPPILFTPFVNPGTNAIALFSANFQPLAPNGVQTVQYQVQYSASCGNSTATGSINNLAIVNGPATGSALVTSSMPALPVCPFQVTKSVTNQPSPFNSFPATFGYQVQFTNTSTTQGYTARTLIDSIAIDNNNYGNMQTAYAYTCTATSGVTGLSALSGSFSGLMQYNNPTWAGLKMIDFSSGSGVFFPPSGAVTCMISVTLQQPPTNDSKCEGDGLANFENDAFMDPSYPYNTNMGQPVFLAQVSKPLPKCVSIVAGKIVSPNVIAGSPVTFTLTLHNAGNNSTTTGGINLLDTLPSGFTFVSWGCLPPTACTATGSGFVTLAQIPGGGTATVLLNAIAPSVPGVYCNKVDATFNPGPLPPLTFFEGNQAQLTTASACVQVSAPTPPKLVKKFSPNPVNLGQPVNVVFTITNGAGQPAQSGLNFSDALPNPPFTLATLQSNTCGGTVSVNGNIVTLHNGTVPAGPSQCTLVFQAVPNKCGVVKNDDKNIHESTGLNYHDLNAELIVNCISNDPCCPPWNMDLLKQMMVYQGSGLLGGPYRLKFQPTTTFNNQMQAYINYLHSVNVLITDIIIAFRLHDQGTGTLPSTGWGPQIPPTAFVKWTWNTTGIGSPTVSPVTGFFIPPAYPSYPMQVGTWYAVTTGIFLNSPQTFFPDKCAEVTIYSRVPANDKDTRREPVLDFSDGQKVIATVPIGRGPN